MGRRTRAFTLMLVLVPATPAHAQDKGQQPLVDALAQCLEIAADRNRLACTDVAARALVDASRRKDLVVVERAEIRRTRRSLFGLSLDTGNLFGGRDAPADRIETLETAIAAASPMANDRWSLALAEGGRWQTTEPWVGGTDPRPGLAVSIRRAALGSYVLHAEGIRSLKVRRTN